MADSQHPAVVLAQALAAQEAAQWEHDMAIDGRTAVRWLIRDYGETPERAQEWELVLAEVARTEAAVAEAALQVERAMAAFEG